METLLILLFFFLYNKDENCLCSHPTIQRSSNQPERGSVINQLVIRQTRSVSFAVCEALIHIHTWAYVICSVRVVSLVVDVVVQSDFGVVTLARTLMLVTQKANQWQTPPS